MTRPDLVPPLANTVDLKKAAAAGARNSQYCLSTSDAHNEANISRPTAASLAAMPDAIDIAADVGGKVQLCIATAFTVTHLIGRVARETPSRRIVFHGHDT